MSASCAASEASLPSPLIPPAVTFGVQIYDDATAERLTLQAKRHVARHAHTVHTPCTRGAMRTHELLLREQALSVGFRSFFTSPEGGNQLGSGWLSIIGGGTILGGLVGIAMYVKHRSRRDALTPAGDDYHRITEPQ